MLFNRDRALACMQRYGLEVLVATSPVNISYFSDHFLWIDPIFKEYMVRPGASSDLLQAYAVFPLEGEPALVLNPLVAANAVDLWVKDLHFFGPTGLDTSLPVGPLTAEQEQHLELVQRPHDNATATDALLGILNDRGLSGARIGLELDGLPQQRAAAIDAALPRAQLRDCSNLLRYIRAVKSAAEIDRLTKAAQISEAVAMEGLATARVGQPIAELVEHYRAGVAGLGANFDHYAFGLRGLGLATEPDYVLRREDVLYVDFGCIYQYYFSDSGTTLAMEPLEGVMAERFAVFRACMDAGIAALQPGVKASQARAAMARILDEHRISGSFPHGHGLGLEVRDYPIVVDDNGLRLQDECIDLASDLPFETDMVINLEAPIFMAGVGSIHIEESFLVTARGSRPLVEQKRAEPFVP